MQNLNHKEIDQVVGGGVIGDYFYRFFVGACKIFIFVGTVLFVVKKGK